MHRAHQRAARRRRRSSWQRSGKQAGLKCLTAIAGWVMLSKIFHTINFCDPLKRFTQIDRIIECCCCCCSMTSLRPQAWPWTHEKCESLAHATPQSTTHSARPSTLCTFTLSACSPHNSADLLHTHTHKVSQFACAKLCAAAGAWGRMADWAWPIKCMYIIINSHSLSD